MPQPPNDPPRPPEISDELVEIAVKWRMQGIDALSEKEHRLLVEAQKRGVDVLTLGGYAPDHPIRGRRA